MFKENVRKTRHKSPRFRDAFDPDSHWRDREETRNLQKKFNKRKQKNRSRLGKW